MKYVFCNRSSYPPSSSVHIIQHSLSSVRRQSAHPVSVPVISVLDRRERYTLRGHKLRETACCEVDGNNSWSGDEITGEAQGTRHEEGRATAKRETKCFTLLCSELVLLLCDFGRFLVDMLYL